MSCYLFVDDSQIQISKSCSPDICIQLPIHVATWVYYGPFKSSSSSSLGFSVSVAQPKGWSTLFTTAWFYTLSSTRTPFSLTQTLTCGKCLANTYSFVRPNNGSVPCWAKVSSLSWVSQGIWLHSVGRRFLQGLEHFMNLILLLDCKLLEGTICILTAIAT